MANITLTADIVAKEAVMILDNNLVMAKKVFRGYEEDFAKRVNSYKIGDTLRIRKPADFTVRDGATMNTQDVVEGTTSIVVDKRKGVDFQFTSQDLTLNIEQLSERVIKPAMVQLANQVDRDLMDLYKFVPSWVGTPGETVDSFADFALAPERLDEMAVPVNDRCAVLAPADFWGLLGSQTGLFIQQEARGAYRDGSLGRIGGVQTYEAQNVPTHINGGDFTGITFNAELIDGTVTYDDVKDNFQQTHAITGSTDLNPGDVFTISGVNAVNPVTKEDTGFERQFTVIELDGTDLTFTPPIIFSGSQQTISTSITDLNGDSLTFVGSADGEHRQNMVFHKNAFSLVMVDLASPPGAIEVARRSYKGCRVRVIPVYDGVNDVSRWRLDVLYGVKAVDPRLATRLSGTAA